VSLFVYGGFFLTHYTHLFFTTGLNSLMTIYFMIMFGCHVRQCLVNLTTNEMENAWRYDYLQRTVAKKSPRDDPTDSPPGVNAVEFHNPFDRGYIVNCTDSFFRPCIMASSGRGRLLGSDGHLKAMPSDTFHDYFKLQAEDMDECNTRTPRIAELLSMKQRGAHHKYDPLDVEDSAV